MYLPCDQRQEGSDVLDAKLGHACRVETWGLCLRQVASRATDEHSESSWENSDVFAARSREAHQTLIVRASGFGIRRVALLTRVSNRLAGSQLQPSNLQHLDRS